MIIAAPLVSQKSETMVKHRWWDGPSSWVNYCSVQMHEESPELLPLKLLSITFKN